MNESRSYRYRVVDVFTDRPLEGNPLAVFYEASGLDDSTMQKIAREMSLPETTFVFPPNRPEASAMVRIFTPQREMAFAGHPTLGTAYVLREKGLVPSDTVNLLLEEKVGLVSVRMEAGDSPVTWLRTPAITEGPQVERGLCAAALGLEVEGLLDISPQQLSAGNPTVYIALKSREAVDRAVLSGEGYAGIRKRFAEPVCIFIFTPSTEGAYARMFAPEHGIPEDPATGSATGPLALFMMRNDLVSGKAGTRFVSEQGTRMGRRSLLYVHIQGDQGREGIDVGGRVTPVAEGILTI
jgi:trans-2,3-dihydro-3-hydroxyanthranilate isomerase